MLVFIPELLSLLWNLHKLEPLQSSQSQCLPGATLEKHGNHGREENDGIKSLMEDL